MLKQCMSVCSKHRKHTTITQNIGKMVKKINYDAYTNGNILRIKQHAVSVRYISNEYYLTKMTSMKIYYVIAFSITSKFKLL